MLFAVHLVTNGASGGAEDTLLNSYPMIMSHDSASGEIVEERDHVVVDWTRTQSVGLVGQLNCGARSFDYRPYLQGQTVFAHHGPVVVHKQMSESLAEVVDWLAAAPDELVVMYMTDCAGDEGCTEAAQALLDAAHISTLSDCADLRDLTFAGARLRGRLGSGGSLLAVLECVTSNYVPEVNCYGANFVCYDSWPAGTSDVPWDSLKSYAAAVTGADPTTASPNLWMTQLHWQSTALSVSLGALHNSSLLRDEALAGVNAWVEQALLSGDFKYLNFVELDNVCDNGLAVRAALQRRLGA